MQHIRIKYNTPPESYSIKFDNNLINEHFSALADVCNEQ